MYKFMRHMVVFFNVVDAGGVSKAATRLNLSKSVVSQQLKALEIELGVSLLYRNTRHQKLTQAGEQFYLECQLLNEIAEQAWQDARGSQSALRGALRLTAPNALIDSIIAPAISDLLSEHPAISLKLIAGDDRLNLIVESIDLAIRVGALPSSEYKQQKLGEFRDVLCAAPNFIHKKGLSVPISLNDTNMLNLDYIANSWQGTNINHELFCESTGSALNLKFRSSYQCNSMSAVVAMAVQGAGLAYVPEFIFEPHRKRGDLIAFVPGYYSSKVPIYAVHSFSGRASYVVVKAIEKIRDQLSLISGFSY